MNETFVKRKSVKVKVAVANQWPGCEDAPCGGPLMVPLVVVTDLYLVLRTWIKPFLRRDSRCA